MAGEGGENGGGGGNHPIFAEEDELQDSLSWKLARMGLEGWRPFFSIIEGRGETWLVAERTYIESLPPMPIGQREGKTSAPLTAASPIACSPRSLEEGEEEDGRQSCVCAL